MSQKYLRATIGSKNKMPNTKSFVSLGSRNFSNITMMQSAESLQTPRECQLQ